MNSRHLLISRSAITCSKSLFSSVKTSAGSQHITSQRNFSVSKTRNMKLLQFSYKEKPEEIRVGFLDGDIVVDLNKADPSIPTTLLEILRRGDLDKVQRISTTKASVPLASIILKAPITGVDKVLCIGLNYKDHCEEQKLTAPPVPMIFSKFASTIVGPNEPVRLRTGMTKVPFNTEGQEKQLFYVFHERRL